MHTKSLTICLLLAIVSCSSTNKTTDSDNSFKFETIPIELTTHLGYQQNFWVGDEIQFLLSLGSDAYIYMYHIDTTGNISQILPNKQQTSNLYRAGYFLTIPEYKDGYRFTVDKQLGEEFIWVIASDQLTSLDKKPVSIKNIKERIKQGAKLSYGEYVYKIKIVKQ